MMKAEPKHLLLPPMLKPGDTIGIAAPSSPFDTETFQQGLAVLEHMGFRIHVPRGLFKKSGYLAGTDSHRAALVNRLFSNEKIKGIICARGGFGAVRILPLLEYKMIREHPKFFMGFSDASALLAALYSRCQLVTFHGPMVTTLGRASRMTRNALRSALVQNQRIQIHLKNGVTIKPGTARGPVIGGNLTTLTHLLGTDFMPVFKRHILFLEDRGESVYRIDRMLTQMKMAGCLQDVLGLVLGSFSARKHMEEIFKVVDAIFAGSNIPILAGFMVGHGRTNLALPIGLSAILDADAQLLRYETAGLR